MCEISAELITRHVDAGLKFRWANIRVELYASAEYSPDLQYDEESRLLKTACCSSAIELSILSCIQ